MAAVMGLVIMVLWVGGIVFMAYLWCRIVARMGFHWAWGLVMLVPVANIVLTAVLAFQPWPVQQAPAEGGAPPAKAMPAPVIAVIVIVALIPAFALMAAIAIPNLLQARMYANDALAKGNLRAVSMAAENFAIAHPDHVFPSTIQDLLNAAPPNIHAGFCGSAASGFHYECQFSAAGYKVTATPLAPGASGSRTFTITTGGIMFDGPDSRATH